MHFEDISIDDIGLSVRAKNALHKSEIDTVGAMINCDEAMLFGIRNLGVKTVEEILAKAAEYRQRMKQGEDIPAGEISPATGDILSHQAGRNFAMKWMNRQELGIDALPLLPARAYNLLDMAGYEQLSSIVMMSEADLSQIPLMDSTSAHQIRMLCDDWLKENIGQLQKAYEVEANQLTAADLLRMPQHHNAIMRYVRMNDHPLKEMELPKRIVDRLHARGYHQLSDILLLPKPELKAVPMTPSAIEEVLSKINAYLNKHNDRMVAFCSGDESVLVDDAFIQQKILDLYESNAFGGFSLDEMLERMALPDSVSVDRVKHCVGQLLARKELEYVDFRCYRLYDRFEDVYPSCPELDERDLDMIGKRLAGQTLEDIGADYQLTRERIRQILKKAVQTVCDWYSAQSGKKWFDEDYYRYFYETYEFDRKDAGQWFGMDTAVIKYLDLRDVKQGNTDLLSALDDKQNLDVGLRLKVKNYLNRNKLFIDGMWVEKRRTDLEALVVRKLCQDAVTFNTFVERYNRFLTDEEIEYDEKIYMTDAVQRARKARLSESRFLLWTQNEHLRYYDIDGRDFTELLDELNLEAYENIILSTMKLVEEHPDVLQKYDIRDQYELHNLLRKIIPDGYYHDFHCEKMPSIRFGTFDRDSAMLEMLINHAPITAKDLSTLIHAEYGYDPAVIQGTYLAPFSEYFHQGTYRIDQKQMSSEHKTTLQAVLSEDFYFIDEIKDAFRRLFPDADQEEINPYTLKQMGFIVLSRYAVQNHPTLDAFFEHLLTKDDFFALMPYRQRFGSMGIFSNRLNEMKRSLQIIEYEPNQVVSFRKLASSGITMDTIRDFCDDVYEFADDSVYFSIQSIKQDGFESVLFDMGFSDWFYANLLISDERFASGLMFGNLIFFKGKKEITIKSFETHLIRESVSIDTYDLMTEMTERYGCRIADRSDLIQKIQNTEIYHDKILDRLYANADVYYRELDETEGF